MKLRFGSVCSGIEAASVAWNPLGWEAAWFSEIEPFPCAVLQHHYPDVQNIGDMTKLPELILSGEVEAPDMLCGGPPCQAFSVAGQRRSLDDERGSLSLVFCEVANAIDTIRSVQRKQPSIIFWENVPGVLNTKDNAFGCFLAELVGADAPLSSGAGNKWPSAGYVAGPKRQAAWRVLDAQYFGVPQRRSRVFVVSSARDDVCPGKILFERTGLPGDFESCRETGKSSAGEPQDCTRSASENARIVGTLTAGDFIKGGATNQSVDSEVMDEKIYDMTHADKVIVTHDICPPLLARMGTGGNQVPMVLQEAYRISSDTSNVMLSNNPNTGIKRAEISPTLDTVDLSPSKAQGGIAIVQATERYRVRKLTPVECERLQGFPDNYTRIPYRNKSEEECPDSPRYKAIGNSWAVPCVRWIGKRIKQQLEEEDQ